jgi:hypothetical protein
VESASVGVGLMSGTDHPVFQFRSLLSHLPNDGGLSLHLLSLLGIF